MARSSSSPVSLALTVTPAYDVNKVSPGIHPASAGGTNPNRGKRRTNHPLAPPARLTVKRGALRSSVTVIRVDVATLRASRARTRNGNVSDAVIDSGTVIARNVKSRGTLRKVARAS
jgi:hypothetical protein